MARRPRPTSPRPSLPSTAPLEAPRRATSSLFENYRCGSPQSPKRTVQGSRIRRHDRPPRRGRQRPLPRQDHMDPPRALPTFASLPTPAASEAPTTTKMPPRNLRRRLPLPTATTSSRRRRRPTAPSLSPRLVRCHLLRRGRPKTLGRETKLPTERGWKSGEAHLPIRQPLPGIPPSPRQPKPAAKRRRRSLTGPTPTGGHLSSGRDAARYRRVTTRVPWTPVGSWSAPVAS